VIAASFVSKFALLRNDLFQQADSVALWTLHIKLFMALSYSILPGLRLHSENQSSFSTFCTSYNNLLENKIGQYKWEKSKEEFIYF
jgi:hypothetical protein